MEPTPQPVPAPARPDSAVTRFGGAAARLLAGARGSLGMHLAIFAVSLLLIAGIWAAAVVQAQRERQSAIDTTNRQNSNLAIAFEEHTVRTLKGVDAAVLLIAHEFERFGAATEIAKFFEDGLINGRLFESRGRRRARRARDQQPEAAAAEYLRPRLLQGSRKRAHPRPVPARGGRRHLAGRGARGVFAKPPSLLLRRRDLERDRRAVQLPSDARLAPEEPGARSVVGERDAVSHPAHPAESPPRLMA